MDELRLVQQALVKVVAKLHPAGDEVSELQLAGVAPHRILSLYPLDFPQLGQWYAEHFKTSEALLGFEDESQNLSSLMPRRHLLPSPLVSKARLAGWTSIVPSTFYFGPEDVKSPALAKLISEVGIAGNRVAHSLIRSSTALWYGVHCEQLAAEHHASLLASLRLLNSALRIS